MIINKKGFLLGEETLKVIIAVICIIFLIYLLGSLYYNSVKDKDVDLAKASVEYLVKEINAGSKEIEIYNPKGWVIINLVQDPNYICICENADECDPDDTCKKPSNKISIQSEGIIIEKPYTLQLNNNILTKKVVEE